MYRGVLSQQSAGTIFITIFSLIIVGSLSSSLLIDLICHIHSKIYDYSCSSINTYLYEHINILRTAQLIQSIFTFLLPAIFAANIISIKPTSFLNINTTCTTSKYALAGVCIVILLPVITLSSLLNESISFSYFLEPLEQIFQKWETQAKELTYLLINTKSPIEIGYNYLIIAIVAAVAEEFLFRGVIQNILVYRLKNHHSAIWIAAAIFSFTHFQIYGFVPRLILGAYLGYLLYWTRCLYIPIFAHFCNNAFTLTVMYGIENRLSNSQNLSPLNLSESALLSVPSIIIFFWLTKSLKQNTE
ncbi:MAG: lysostaphin resistance A-like protein [Tannerellaceae bacterium]